MIRYINMKTPEGEIETVDEFSSEGYVRKDNYNLNFYSYVRKMVSEYNFGDGYNYYYLSQRCTNEWRNK